MVTADDFAESFACLFLLLLRAAELQLLVLRWIVGAHQDLYANAPAPQLTIEKTLI